MERKLALHFAVRLLGTVNGYSVVLESNMSSQFLKKLA